MWPVKLRSYAVTQMAYIHYSRRALACKSLPRAFAKSYRVSNLHRETVIISHIQLSSILGSIRCH